MFGSDPFGSVPFGASGSTPFDYDAMLASSREELVYTVALQVWNVATNTLSTLYLGSSEWATSPTDIPASTPFDGRLTTVLSFSRSVVDQSRLGINFTAGDGSIVFANPDGAYDTYVDAYALGREVVVRVGRKTDSFANHLVIFKGLAVDWFADQDSVTVTIRDKGFLLDVPAQPNVYAGTGDAEGDSNLTGKRKPILYGAPVGVPPPLVDATRLIYQINDGALEAATTLMLDRGTAVVLATNRASYAALKAAAAPAAGFFDSCIAEGFVRLGSTPAGFVIGVSQAAGVLTVFTVGYVVRDLLTSATDLTDADIDEASFDAAEVIQPAPVSHFIGQDESATAAEAVAGIMAGVGGWGGFDRQGLFGIGILVAPSGDPVAYFKRAEGDIIDLRREKLPSGVWPPPWRWRVAHSRNFTVTDDFAGSVSSAFRALYAQPYNLVTATDAGVLTDYPRAIDPPPVESHYTDSADAQDEADRLLALYSAGYQLYRITLTRRALTLDIGDAINVTFPRYGLDAGVLMRVVEISDNIAIGDGSEVDQVEVVAFG